MEPIRRSIETELSRDEEGRYHCVARLADPFHEIEVRLAVRCADLTIIEASASMARVPYAGHCPDALPSVGTLAGLAIGKNLFRNVGQAVGGASGCPYLVELVTQACKLAILAAGAERARQAVLVEHDLEKFGTIRSTMGECAGHADLPGEVLPAWLERERKERSESG